MRRLGHNFEYEPTQHLPVTGVFVAIGNDPRVDLVRGVLELTTEGTIAVQGRTSKTSLPGVFAAGDVIDPTYRQAITASGSGCVAAIDVEHYLADLGDSVETAAEVPTPPAEQVSEDAHVSSTTQGE